MMVFTPVYFSVTTVLGGSCSFSVQIPGTYAGVFPVNATAGRWLQEVQIWADSAVNGDVISDLKLTDTDGVVTTPERAFLPNYPDVVRFYDTTVTGTDGSGLLLHNNPPMVVRPFESDGQPVVRLLPAQLYLTGTFTSGSLSIGKTFRVNLIWARWVPS